MSIELVSRVLRKSGYGGADQQVLVILCDYADDRGYCYPSMLRIAWETGLTERAVRNVMRRLEAAGTVTTTEHRGARNSNEYQIHLESGPQKEPWETYRDRHKRPGKSERGSAINQNGVPHKPESGSEIKRKENRNVVPPKSEPDDRKSEPDDKKPERGSGEPSLDPLLEPPVDPPIGAEAPKPLPDNGPIQKIVKAWYERAGVEPANYAKALGFAKQLHAARVTPRELSEMYDWYAADPWRVERGFDLGSCVADIEKFRQSKRLPKPARKEKPGLFAGFEEFDRMVKGDQDKAEQYDNVIEPEWSVR